MNNVIEDRTLEEQTLPLRTVVASYGQSVAAIDSTMVAMEERTQSLRTVAITHGLISGGNGGVKLVRVIIQSKLLPISGCN